MHSLQPPAISTALMSKRKRLVEWSDCKQSRV